MAIESGASLKKNPVRQMLPLIALVVGALLIRPWIKPWLATHRAEIAPITFISFIPWVIFSLYWEIAAKNSAPAISSESKASRTVHVVLTNVALLLIFFPVRGLNHRFEPNALPVKLIGLVLECVALALAIWARRILGRNWSGEITIKEDHKLVQCGPYKVVRHPIYLAILLMYAGTAIVSGQMHALAGLAVAILAYLRKTRMEEANLVKAFGKRYDEYREKTWAIVPGLF